MPNQTINRIWFSQYRNHLVVVLSVVIGGLLGVTFFKGCSAIGADSHRDVYTPSADNGFIYKSNLLLSELIEEAQQKNPNHPRSLKELNNKYGALQFELPYNYVEAAGGRASDIRLVAINPDSIHSSSLRQFYYNSDLPALLAKQKQNLGERIFNIVFDRGGLEIKSIKLVPSMFRLSLVKDSWKGTIIAQENSLFPTKNHCFITWGMNMIPLRMNAASRGDYIITADFEAKRFSHMGHAVDYYECFQKYNNDSTKVIINLGNDGDCVKIEYLSYHKLRIKTEGSICCTTLDSIGHVSQTFFSEAGKGDVTHDFTNDLKLIITDKNGIKITEFVLTHHNPMRNLSMVVSSSAGRSRYFEARNFTDRFTQQVIRGLSSTMNNTLYSDTIPLSIDPLLSVAFEQELKNYCEQVLKTSQNINALPTDQWELSMTVMDMATGNVVAMPYYRTEDNKIDYNIAISRKNPALLRRYIGSTFKPLLALAAVQTEPSLVHLNTVGKYHLLPSTIRLDGDGNPVRAKAQFYGNEIEAWSLAGKTRRFWNGSSTLGEFIASSDDVYPVALAVLSLAGVDGSEATYDFSRSNAFRQNLLVEKDADRINWTEQSLVKNINYLYDLKSYNSVYAQDSLDMSYYIWRNLQLKGDELLGLESINPDATVMYYQNFLDPPHNVRSNLVPWVLGQGTNEWNCVKLAEAWTRMLTKHEVKASFIGRTTVSPSLLPLLKNHIGKDPNEVWNQFLDEMLYAQNHSPGLLSPMNDAVNSLDANLLLFSKTGTPNNYVRPEWKTVDGRSHWLDVGLYCMGLMSSDAYQSVRVGGPAKGLMCVIRITRITNEKPEDDGVSSTHARNFFSANQLRLRKFYEMTRMYY